MKVDGPFQYLKVNMNGIFCYKQGLTRKSVDFRQIYLDIFIEDFSNFWKKRDYFSVFGCGSNDDFALGSLK